MPWPNKPLLFQYRQLLARKRGTMRVVSNTCQQDICEHAAITPELYADASIGTAEWWKGNYMRQFLLKRADRYDLKAVKEKAGYAGLNPEFHGDIEEPLKQSSLKELGTKIFEEFKLPRKHLRSLDILGCLKLLLN